MQIVLWADALQTGHNMPRELAAFPSRCTRRAIRALSATRHQKAVAQTGARPHC